MHIAQLLNALLLAVDVEVIEAALPEVRFEFWRPQRLLRGSAKFPLAGEQATCDATLEGMHHPRWIAAPGLTHQQMKMFGHDHVAEDAKAVILADLLQDQQERIPASPS